MRQLRFAPTPYPPTPSELLHKTPLPKPPKKHSFVPLFWKNTIQICPPPRLHTSISLALNQSPPTTEHENSHPSKNTLFAISLTRYTTTSYQNHPALVAHPLPRSLPHQPRERRVNTNTKTPYSITPKSPILDDSPGAANFSPTTNKRQPEARVSWASRIWGASPPGPVGSKAAPQNP